MELVAFYSVDALVVSCRELRAVNQYRINRFQGQNMAQRRDLEQGQWSHGHIRRYIKYKAEGIRVVGDVDEAYTSQTCCYCGQHHKPCGRVSVCPGPACRAVYPRDVGESSNILSQYLYDELAQVNAPVPVYFRPLQKKVSWPVASRSRADTPEMAQMLA